MDWNQPDVIGYSFYVWGNSVMKIIPHKVSEKHLYNFSTREQYTYSWVYFPVDPDERISEVWIRRFGVRLNEEFSGAASTLIVSSRPSHIDSLLTTSS